AWAGPGVTASAPVTTIARKATCFVISTNVASCSGRVKLSFRRTRTGYHGRSCKASDCRQCDCVTGWRRTLHRGSYNAVSVNGREGSDDAPDRTAATVVGRPGARRGDRGRGSRADRAQGRARRIRRGELDGRRAG